MHNDSLSAILTQNIDPDVVRQHFGRGEGTGPVSRTLSGLTLMAGTLLIVQMVKDEQYIPLVLFAIFAWKLNAFFTPCLAIYFAITLYWTGLLLCLISIVLLWISVAVGARSIRWHLCNGLPMINEFEGDFSIRMCFTVEYILVALALLTTSWFSILSWVVFCVVAFYLICCYVLRLFPKWKRVHLPLRYRYAKVAARESFESEREGREFDLERASEALLDTVYSDADLAKEIKECAARKVDTFEDRDEIALELQASYGNRLDPTKLNKLLDSIQADLRKQRGRRVRDFAIAEVVEHMFGPEERTKYLCALFKGDAF